MELRSDRKRRRRFLILWLQDFRSGISTAWRFGGARLVGCLASSPLCRYRICNYWIWDNKKEQVPECEILLELRYSSLILCDWNHWHRGCRCWLYSDLSRDRNEFYKYLIRKVLVSPLLFFDWSFRQRTSGCSHVLLSYKISLNQFISSLQGTHEWQCNYWKVNSGVINELYFCWFHNMLLL